jgi:cyanophycinase
LTSTTAGPIALVGSGEYLVQMREFEGSLLTGRAAKYVQLATASVPDGPQVVKRWHDLGRSQAAALGVEAVIVPVTNVDDANRPEFVEMIRGAGLIYLSGGDPGFLANTLRDSAIWDAIVNEWKTGAALAGCSAGAMAMTSWIPSIRHPKEGGTVGLGLLPQLRVIPHFDRFAARIPDVFTRFLLPDDKNISVIGIDEDTAIVGDGHTWKVVGQQSAWLLSHDGREQFAAGTLVTTPQMAG